jgi:ankyrin repeat protein
LQHGADPNAEDNDGFTPLDAVFQREGEPELELLIDLLLSYGADPNLPFLGEEENSLLHWTTEKDNFHLVNKLLNKRADANRKNAKGETPLHVAVRTSGSDLSVMALLLDEGGADPCVTDNQGMTPLMTMCSHDYSYADRTDIIDLLLCYVSPPKTLYINARDKARRNALMYAGTKLYGARQVLHLLKLGADPFQLDSEGANILLHITKKSVSKDALDAFETLVQNGVDANCSDNTGKTALHYMAIRNVPIAEAMPVLLTCGVDLYRKDHSGKIPLMYACMKSDPTNTYILLQAMVGYS